MEIYNIDYFEKNKIFFEEQALNQKLFIYPTDTIYWIGAIITANTVEKIYKIKQRNLIKPLSIIAPNIKWIQQHFNVPADFPKILDKLLNKYHWITLVLPKKDKDFLPELGDIDKLGIRIIKTNLQNFVDKLWQPFISTSVNISWKSSIKSIDELDETIARQIDIFIDGGILNNPPSVLIDLDSEEINFRK